MNLDLFRYKTRFLTCILLFSYAYLHIQLTGQYIDATLEQLITFSAKLPFGQRLLVPALAHYLNGFFPLGASNLFFILELFFVSLFYLAMQQLLQHEFSPRNATVLTWLFMLLLPLVTVINYGATVGTIKAFYYPYDTATLFFMATGFLLCLRAQWGLLSILIPFATLNRESSILLVLLIPLLHYSHLKSVLKPFALIALLYFITKIIIIFLVQHLPGQLLELQHKNLNISHFDVNLFWLLDNHFLFLFLYSMAMLPLFWFAFYDYIPPQYKPIRYLTLGYFLGLLLVGSIAEARIYSEIVILLYLPVCIAVSRWLNQETIVIEKTGALFYLNCHAILGTLIIVALIRQYCCFQIV